MTKKDFEALAQALRHTRPNKPHSQRHNEALLDRGYQWERDMVAIADVCAAANGRFDRERFYAACNKE